MGLKKYKVVVYKTSDGTKFIGGETKADAKDHEKEIQSFLKEFRLTEFVFQTCGIEDQLTEIDESSILTYFYKMAEDDTDNGIRERLDDIVEEAIAELLQSAQCPSDLSDVEDMLDMICAIIDDLGGIDSVVELYKHNMTITQERK